MSLVIEHSQQRNTVCKKKIREEVVAKIKPILSDVISCSVRIEEIYGRVIYQISDWYTGIDSSLSTEQNFVSPDSLTECQCEIVREVAVTETAARDQGLTRVDDSLSPLKRSLRYRATKGS